MIAPVLVLGGFRYLSVDGTILQPDRVFSDADIAAQRVFDSDFDPEIESAPGDPEIINPRRRPYWEAVAQRAGYQLDDLLTTR
ncbi:hypothetical protein [Rhodococcus sp. 14-2470-1a]|uniref:hypothetical protein n=1 Tax=Rhodococcus sp. 14-2470-1a TaxID=2023150 RepID=UPI000B9C1729|nr:hypothetical protein [Rhodococcus sp. 14-2470-1a]OZF47561.1 hypothetical protein CH292_19245 [Rhodococcus sp. 14-2470-1a]